MFISLSQQLQSRCLKVVKTPNLRVDNMNTDYRKSLPNSELDYFDTREAVEAIKPGAYASLPYTSRVLAEQLVRRCDPSALTDSLNQLIERKQDLDFPW